MTARLGELRIVLAHGVTKASSLFEVPAVLTAEVGSCVPHTLSVARADGFSGVAVTALTLAGAVGLALGAELWFTPRDEVTSRIATRFSTEVQPGHVGDVEVDPDGLGAARSVGEFESGGSLDTVGGDFVDVNAVNTSNVLAGSACISDTDGSTECGVLSLEADLERSVRDIGVGRELDGGRPGRTVHVVLGLVVDSVRASGRSNTKRGDQSADFRLVVGSVDVANRGVGAAVSVILLLLAGLDTELLVSVPQAVAVSHTRLLSDVGDTARTVAGRDAPVAGSVGVTVFFSRVLTLGLAFTLSSEEAAVVFGTTLARPIASRASIHASFVFELTSRIASADGVVGDLVALTEAEFAGEIPLAFLTAIRFPAGAVVDVGEPLAAEAALLGGVVPEASGGSSTVGHESAARAVGAADIVVIPDAVDVGLALLLIPTAVLTVGDALATLPIALRVFGALVFFSRSVGNFATLFALHVGTVPQAVFGFSGAAFFRCRADATRETASVVVEEVALLIFRLGRAGGVLNQDLAVHAAFLFGSAVEAFRIGIAIISAGVATAVATDLALGGRGGVVGEPGAVSGVGASTDVLVLIAGRAADVVDSIPNTFATSVSLVVTVGRGGVSRADRAAFTRALEFEDHVTEQVAVGHILNVECQDASSSQRVTVGVRIGSRKTSREGGPVQNVGGGRVEVSAITSGGGARLKSTLDVVVGGASSLGVAREEGKLNVDIALASRNRLMELHDLAASVVGTHVVDSHVVEAEEANIDSAVEVFSPDAVARSVITASVLGVEVALLVATFLLGPVPVAILVVITVLLLLVLPLALSVADLKISVPFASSEVEATVLGGEDRALLVTLFGRRLPCAGVVSLALGLDGVITALACAVTLGVVIGIEDPAAADVV